MSTSPPRRRPADPAAGARGVDLTRPERSSRPHMPHERDESTGSTGGVPSERVQQGYGDVERGVQDTSRAPEADTAYRALKRKAARVGGVFKRR